jgi:hypothetical protein
MPNLRESIENPVTGESMTFLLTGRDTKGELLRIDMRVRPSGFASGEHIHPRQEERFQIDRGQTTLRIRGQERRNELRVLVEFRPAGRFAEFITTYFALGRTGRVNDRGIPTNPLQLAVTFAEYQEVLRGTSPPIMVQRILFATLAPLGRLMGYTPDVPYD